MHTHDLDPAALPWSPEAESAVLGCLLMDNSTWDRVGDLLLSRHFYESANGVIFDTIGGMILADKLADVVTVYAKLETIGKAEEVGGYAYLNALAQSIAGTGGARRYAEVIADRALMRGILEGADKVRELAIEPGLPAAERLDKAQEVLQALQVNRGRVMPTSIESQVVGLLDRIQDAADGRRQVGLPTGIPGLDRMLGGGFKGGKQIIIAARPSIGKSSLAQQFCLNLAMAGYPAAFFSQEMSKDELMDRAVANIGRIPLDNIISGQLTEDQWPRLSEAIEKMRGLPLYLDEQPALTLHDIAAKARMLKRQHGIQAIVIDYIQLCGSIGKDSDNRHHQIEQLSRGLKTLGKQLDITTITLSQLNREVEKRTTGRPVLSDLKESGSIEEDADVVILLSRGAVTPDGFQVINCDVPKNRQGKVGALALGFDSALQRWHETVAPLQFKQPPRKHYTEDV